MPDRDTVWQAILDLQADIGRLRSSGAIPSILSMPWQAVTHASPAGSIAALPAKLAADTSAGPVNLTVPAATDGAILAISMWVGANPVNLTPPGGVTMADPSNGNAQAAPGGAVKMVSQGSVQWWQFQAALSRWIALVSDA